MERIIILHIYSPTLNFSHKQALSYNQHIGLGRSSDSDVHIRDLNIARNQIELKLTPSGFLISNLDANLDIFLNQELIINPCFFVPGDLLQFSSTSIQFEYQSNKSLVANPHQMVENNKVSDLSFEYYINHNLTETFPPTIAEDQYMTNDVYMKLLSFPFLLLFSLFLIFPSLSSCAITLAYLAIAHTLVIKFTKSQIPMSNFRLPISQKIYDQQKEVIKKIKALPDFDQKLLKNIKDEIKNFVKVKLPKVERDIFSLNTSLKPEVQQKLLQRENSLKTQLSTVKDERLNKQLNKSLSLVGKQAKMHQNTKNLLMGLVLKLQDFQIQLDLLEGTLITHSFKDISSDFSERFHELQSEIDEYYSEFQQLNDGSEEAKLLGK
ncbi:FHA domain-containing protein [bacterium]|nr:FHA domain-containing protein [bacterium]